MPQAEERSTTNLTRRSALVGLAGAAAAAGAIPAIAAVGEPDPMLTAIEQYKAALQTRAAVLDAMADFDTYPTNQEWDKAQDEVFHAEHSAFYEMLDTIPTSIAGVVALLEVLGTDPYNEGSYSSAAWAYNNSGGDECPVDRLMLEMAAVLRKASS
jgi:hypothetical protein